MIGTEMYKERIPKPSGSKYADYIYNFMSSDNQTLKFNCSTIEEANSCVTTVKKLISKRDLNLVVWQQNCGVYVIKG